MGDPADPAGPLLRGRPPHPGGARQRRRGGLAAREGLYDPGATRGLEGTKERLGQILPPKTPVKLTTLDGRRVKPRVRGVSRGREVSYATGGGRPHVLRIFAR